MSEQERPKRYDYYDRYQEVDVAAEFAKAKHAANLLAVVAKSVDPANADDFDVFKAAYSAVQKPVEQIDGYWRYRAEEGRYTVRLAEWEAAQIERANGVPAEAVSQ